jgi:hypothetical protein
MTSKQPDVIEQIQGADRTQLRDKPLSQPTAIHYTELPEAAVGDRGGVEWNHYRKEASRLLAEGQEGRWALVKGAEIIGIWDTEKEADACRVQRFLTDDVLIQQIQEWDHVYRCGAYFRPWPS